jgi:acylphosphatase
VEAEFEGPAAAVRQIISWCHDGPPTARVDAVDVEWIEPQNDFSGFSITF